MPIISVIVPVYNAEKYVNQCIDSILCQSFDDFELILIDDGSSDCSFQICNKYKSADNRIQVVHQENKGVSSARNVGLEMATGRYITFVDADDIIYPDALQKHYDIIVENDMSVLGYYRINDSRDIVGIMTGNAYARKLSKEEAIRLLFDESRSIIEVPGLYGYQGYLWNKMFRMDIIKKNSIRFCEDIFYNEDRLFILNYLLFSTRIQIKNEPVYGYRESDGAMSALHKVDNRNIERLLTEMHAYERMVDLLRKWNYTEEYLGCIFATAHQYEKWLRATFYSVRKCRIFLNKKTMFWWETLFSENERLNGGHIVNSSLEVKKRIRRWRIRNRMYHICDLIAWRI